MRRVVKRESNFNPRARNRVYWGLMQIRHDTARGMGYKGTAQGLLDAETNLKYAVKYLRGAYMVADGNHDLPVRFYARGYYYDAKRKGMLDETGLGRDRKRKRTERLSPSRAVRSGSGLASLSPCFGRALLRRRLGGLGRRGTVPRPLSSAAIRAAARSWPRAA